MSSNFLALLLIFGLGHPSREPVDPAKGAALHSRIRCDGYGAPEDLLKVQAIFSPGGSTRQFVVGRYEVDQCSVETMFQCWHKPRAGWHDVWSALSDDQASRAVVPIGSCNEWGSSSEARYILTGWYQDSSSNSKPAWHQAVVKQVSTQPEIYEFTDPAGGSARLEVHR